jgi:hypothetical protein
MEHTTKRGAARLGQSKLRGVRVLRGREQKIEGRARGVHGPVEVASLALDADVRLVHAPRVVRGGEAFA